jgi:hypothetical protein
MNDDSSYGNKEHKVTAARSTDPFDKMLAGLIGLPNGAHTKPAVVQSIDFYGHATTYIVQTVRTDESVTAFVTQVSADGAVRSILPGAVLSVIDRQRESITAKLRRRNGKRIAEERKLAGVTPFVKKEKKA